MYFDTHAHYDDEAFEEDRDAVLAPSEAAGSAATGITAYIQKLKAIFAWFLGILKALVPFGEAVR